MVVVKQTNPRYIMPSCTSEPFALFRRQRPPSVICVQCSVHCLRKRGLIRRCTGHKICYAGIPAQHLVNELVASSCLKPVDSVQNTRFAKGTVNLAQMLSSQVRPSWLYIQLFDTVIRNFRRPAS